MIENNNGECPCHNDEDKHCPCSDYRERMNAIATCMLKIGVRLALGARACEFESHCPTRKPYPPSR